MSPSSRSGEDNNRSSVVLWSKFAAISAVGSLILAGLQPAAAQSPTTTEGRCALRPVVMLYHQALLRLSAEAMRPLSAISPAGMEPWQVVGETQRSELLPGSIRMT